MKFLKGLLLALVSLLFFSTLSLFSFAFVLNRTILNPDFVTGAVDKLNIPQLAREIITRQLPADLEVEVSGSPLPISRDLIIQTVSPVITRLEPELKQQAKTALRSGYDYFLGKSNRLSIVISLESLKSNLKEDLRQSLLESLEKSPPQIPGVPPETVKQMISQYFNQYFDTSYQEFSTGIPDRFEIDETNLKPEAATQIYQVKKYIGYYQTGFKVLIGVMALLILFIILIERNLKGTFRRLGTNLLISGSISFALVFFAEKYAPAAIPFPTEIPPALVSWLMGLTNDLVAPLKPFFIAMATSGATLLVASFFLRSPKPQA